MMTGSGAAVAAPSSPSGSPLGGGSGGDDESERVARALFSDSLPITLAAFFGAGLLLALTPCMLPMVPILSGLIAGQVGGNGRGAGNGGARADRREARLASVAEAGVGMGCHGRWISGGERVGG